MFIRYLCFSQICTWVTIGFLWAYASMLITVVLFRSQKQSQSHTLTHSHSCQELARFWAYQGNSLPSWILIDQSCLILAFYFFSFQEAQKKKKSFTVCSKRKSIWNSGSARGGSPNTPEHVFSSWSMKPRWRMSPSGALNFRTDMPFSYWPAFLTSEQKSGFKWEKETDTCGIMSRLFWIQKCALVFWSVKTCSDHDWIMNKGC